MGWPHTSPAFILHSEKHCQMPHPVTFPGCWLPTSSPGHASHSVPSRAEGALSLSLPLAWRLGWRCPVSAATPHSDGLGTPGEPRDLGQRVRGLRARRPGCQSQSQPRPCAHCVTWGCSRGLCLFWQPGTPAQSPGQLWVSGDPGQLEPHWRFAPCGTRPRSFPGSQVPARHV